MRSPQNRASVAHVAAVHDYVDHAVFLQIFSPLEPFRQLLPHRLLDDARAREADQRAELVARESRVFIRWDRASDAFCQYQKSWLIDARLRPAAASSCGSWGMAETVDSLFWSAQG